MITQEQREQFESDGSERVRYLLGNERYSAGVTDAAFEWLREKERGELLGALSPDNKVSSESRMRFEKAGAAEFAERGKFDREQEALALSAKRAGLIAACAAVIVALVGIALSLRFILRGRLHSASAGTRIV